MTPTDTHSTPRSRPAASRLALGLVVALALAACAGSGAAAPGATQPGAGDSAAPGSSIAASLAPGETAIATGPSDAPRTPGPSVPRVAPLQPPAYASRVVLAGLRIDLPVISGDLQPPPSYPFCDVAAYVTRFSQPYETGITYISAHAQRDMFLPLLQASERNDGQELLGELVEVYVGDGRLFTYRIEQVIRHATDYATLVEIPLDERHLVLQTSEGPYGTVEKLQVVAQFEAESAVDETAANPPATPRDCEPDQAPVASPSPA